jgi:hypothetical protein
LSALGSTRTIYDESISGGTASRFVIRQNASNQIEFRGTSSDNIILNPVTTWVTHQTTLVTNTWYHIVATVDTDNDIQQVYVNGTAATTPGSTVLSTFPNTAPNGIRIMQNVANTNGGSKQSGHLDELALFNNEILSTSKISQMYYRGAVRVNITARSCDDDACSGETLTGKTGASDPFSETNTDYSPLPGADFSQALFPRNRYYQYRVVFTQNTQTLNNVNLKPVLRAISLEFNALPSLSIAIRKNDDTTDINTCNLATASLTSVKTCDYRIKITSDLITSYSIQISTSGGLSNGAYTLANAAAGSGGSGGDDISNGTANTEKYGIVINTGSITGGQINTSRLSQTGGSVTKIGGFDAGTTNAVNANIGPTPQTILTSTGFNRPNATDTTNTTLITHKANISAATPPGVYSQTVTYTIIPSY